MDTPKTTRYITPRAIILALVLAVINDAWIVQMEVVRYSFATYAAPFYNCIFILLVLTVVNHAVKKHSPRIAFTSIELLTIYVMLSIMSGVCSHNMMEILISLMGYGFFFATPENKWGEMFLGKVPKWLTVSDQASLRNFYYGHSTLYDPANFTPWIVPVLSWSAFCAMLLFTVLCINSIMRKQWVESERLTFPVIQLPLEMVDESGSLLRNKYMWMGFAIAGGLTILAGLNYMYPSIPCLRIVRQNIGPYIVNPPWNAVGTLLVGFYFWAIGLAFLMPLEFSFSCWVFYLLTRLELVGSRVMGLNDVGVLGGGFDRTYPFLNSQSYGAYLGFFVMSMWTSRHYLARVFRTAFKGTKEEDESREAISYRTAILGVVGGFLFLVMFALRMGMTPWVVITFFIFYFILIIIISRIRAELGFPIHDAPGMGPQYMMNTVVGSGNLARQDLVGFTLFHWFNRSYASHPGPHQMEAFKLQERTGAIARQMFIAMMIAGFVALPIGFWNLLRVYYHNGGATAHMEQWALGFGNEAWNQLAGWIKSPFGTNKVAMVFVGVGFAISVLLGWMRVQFLWFPLHPLAYAMAMSWGVAQLWVPLMIGGGAKFIALRFGGLGSYRRALPFFFGLILGEIVVGCLWTLIGIAFGIPSYDFWPGHY
jgi:hypothetical protein